MSVIYFTNNADEGDGSLRAAIASAQPGDVIRPDETVFERGATIEIALASTLTIDKDLTLDGGPFRVVLNGGGSVACAAVASGANASFTSFDFVGGATSSSGGGIYVETSAALVLTRCRVAGCSAGSGGGGIYSRRDVALNDCVVTGCVARSENGGGISTTGALVLDGSTVVGNSTGASGADVCATATLAASNSILGDVSTGSATVPDYRGCVVDVASSTIGFVASPPDNLAVDNWNADAWQDWDLRLLDDASGAPSPYRDSGDVGAISRYDLDGNFRGRENEDATTCSPGAYETIQADLFWVGKDATGAEVVSPSFLTSDGWTASRFATVSGDAAPQAGQTLYIGRDVDFVDEPLVIPSLNSHRGKIIVGSGANVYFAVARSTTWKARLVDLDLSVGATLRGPSPSFDTFCGAARCGDSSRVETRLGNGANNYAFSFPYIGQSVYLSQVTATFPVPSSPRYGALRFYVPFADAPSRYFEGDYDCDTVAFSVGNANNAAPIYVKPGVCFRCRSFTYGGNGAEKSAWVTNPIDVRLRDAASAKANGYEKTDRYANHFSVDVTDATSATLTLNGQTVYGDAPTAAVALTGTAKIDERGLDAATLTLTADSSLTVDGGTVCVAELSVADGANIAFSGVNAILTATKTATVGGATFTGIGYFATPTGTDLTAATFTEAVRACNYGAGLQTFFATSVGKSINYRWTAGDIETPVLIEKQVDNAWEVVELHAANGETTFPTESSGNTVYRAFDGETFLQTLIYIAPFHAWLTYDNLFTSAIVVKSYTIVTECILMSTYLNAGEAPVFLARIADSLTSVSVVPSDVESIALTVYKLELYRGVKQRVALDGWENVAVPLTAVMESLIVDDPRWKRDSIGYNFRFEPDLREKELFKDAGEYVAVVTMKFKEGNPAPLVFNITIK